ncbi:hypothetical protein K469DRAFT_711774 [Zopfia rhizophila CBS 207.26]|uniref:Uncharacterized protein n=1 Tax=Zopfia rhizophila CBS 207.26 TaxID=1314779 RepID=A0A6A6DWP0_9PEZI|nr:hypothetical protein K469DRAFT_711774 [Zopfia rhizophila CBS 207.26]
MSSSQSNAPTAPSTAAPTDQENSASTTVDGVNSSGGVNSSNRRIGGGTSNDASQGSQEPTVPVGSLRVATSSEERNRSLEAFSQYPVTDGKPDGSNS